MKDGINIGMTEFSLAAILLTICVVATGFFYVHRPMPAPVAPPCPTVTTTMGPTIEIDQTIYIPVPVAQAPKAPDAVAPQDEDGSFEPLNPQRQVIITDALRHPMEEMQNVSTHGN